MRAELREFALTLAEPLPTAAGEMDRREGWLVRVAGDGETGIGEATPLPGWTESRDACRAALERAVDRLEIDGPDAALATLEDAPAARHGVETALADLRAREADVPLYRSLAKDVETITSVDGVPVNATIGDGDETDTVAAARTAVDSGFSTLKVKVGNRAVGDDANRLRAVRDAVGEGVEFRADANGAWSPGEARAALDEFESIGVEYVEQPLPAGDLDGNAALSDSDRAVGIALDETVAEYGIDAVLDADVADVVILKPMVLGGPTRTVEAADRARASGVEPVVTTTVDGVVARTAAVHATAAIPDPPPAGLATGDRIAEDLGPDPAPIRDGSALVPGDKGLGVGAVWLE
ncbi:MAG TPA: o-succinylbenzoate synthase [Natrialbaceae archaeon]|nr:o-succinylbenzoate synthase [Natrialbaceae archaeon]